MPMPFFEITSEQIFSISAGIIGAVFIAMALQALSVKQLIERCIAKDGNREASWNEFKERFDKLIAIFIYREFRQKCGDAAARRYKEILLDLKQEVYIKLINKDARALRQFRGHNDEMFISFLFMICRNVVRNYIRNQYSRDSRLSSLTHSSDKSFSGSVEIEPPDSDTVEKIDGSELVDHIVKTLRNHYRSREIDRDIYIFKLYYLAGFTSKEIVKNYDHGLSSSGIETLMSRMKNVLKKNM